MATEKVTHGGGLKNVEHGVEQGFEKKARKLWAWGHDDQRASWLMHFLICLTPTAVLGRLFQHVPYVALGVASFMWIVFMCREAGDEDKWRAEGKWDTIDRDTSWLGKLRLGVTRRFDKIGDLTGPTFNMVVWWVAWLVWLR